MKRIFISALLIVAFASCKKLNDVLPESNIPTDETTITPAPVTEEDKKLAASLKITPVVFKTPEQVVTTSVDGNQLNMALNEKVQLLIDKERYALSWYIVFSEDYSGTALDGLDYNTTTQWGTVVKNWKPYNLNQFDKTVTDTTIAGTKVVNVKFERNFSFYKVYDSNEQAVAKQNELIGKTQNIKFQTRYQPDTDTTRFHSIATKIVFKK